MKGHHFRFGGCLFSLVGSAVFVVLGTTTITVPCLAFLSPSSDVRVCEAAQVHEREKVIRTGRQDPGQHAGQVAFVQNCRALP